MTKLLPVLWLLALVVLPAAAQQTSYQDLIRQGNALDFDGKYAEARAAFQKAEAVAPNPDTKSRAQRAIAISYGFEGNCDAVITSEEPEYRRFLSIKDFYNAGEVANELARLCFDAGKLEVAETWYRTGTQAGLKEPNITPERTDLWHYRLEHALARLAARRGNTADADQHIAAARALVDRGHMQANQKEFFPYLTGYVKLVTGDAAGALTDLAAANQSDAYVLGLEAQASERLGQRDKAMGFYQRVLESKTHNPTTAAMRPLATRKLAELSGK